MVVDPTSPSPDAHLARHSPVWAETSRLLLTPGTTEAGSRDDELLAVYRSLLAGIPDSKLLQRRRERYLRAIESVTTGTDRIRLDRTLQTAARDADIPMPEAYASLSENAKHELACLMRTGITPRALMQFLTNPDLTTDHTVEGILALCAELRRHGVDGTAWAFKAQKRDGKLLTPNRTRITAIMHEWREALWTAKMSTSVETALDRQVSIDFARLSPALREYVEHHILPGVAQEAIREHREAGPDPTGSPCVPYQFKERSNLSVDMLCTERRDGYPRRWITEVKSSTRTLGYYEADRGPFKQLQWVRLAMAVHQHQLAGLELRLCAKKIDAHWLQMVIDILRAMNTPYLIHMTDGDRHGLIIDQGLNFSFGVYPDGDRSRPAQRIESVYKHFDANILLAYIRNQKWGTPVHLDWIMKAGRTTPGSPLPPRTVQPAPAFSPDLMAVSATIQHATPPLEMVAPAWSSSNETLPLGWNMGTPPTEPEAVDVGNTATLDTLGTAESWPDLMPLPEMALPAFVPVVRSLYP